jgi:hypothetical protein
MLSSLDALRLMAYHSPCVSAFSHLVPLCLSHFQVEPQRNIATIRLPCQGLPAICALQHPGSSNSSSFEGRGAASSSMSELATLPEEEEQVRPVLRGMLAKQQQLPKSTST